MRDLAFALMLLAALPLAFARPFNAYLLWGWTGLLAPAEVEHHAHVDHQNECFHCPSPLSCAQSAEMRRLMIFSSISVPLGRWATGPLLR